MVKNKMGGSRHKKQASKNFKQSDVQIKTRLKNPKEPCEQYAIVTKNFGQGNCEVLCNDKIKRLCVIRNKFRGRNKRSNQVNLGSRILVGLRDWEVRSSKSKERCDLLEVYLNKQLDDLKRDPNFNATLLRSEMEKSGESEESNLFKFTNDENDENDENDDEITIGVGTENTTNELEELGDIDIDEI